jgi:hypothetical protein
MSKSNVVRLTKFVPLLVLVALAVLFVSTPVSAIHQNPHLVNQGNGPGEVQNVGEPN